MHELSIALSILDIVAEEKQRRGNVRVVSVRLKLGPLSGVVKEALVSAYDMAREVSESPDAELRIEETPVTIFCGKCQAERKIESIQDFRCCECGTPGGKVLTGKEMEITAMEIES